MQEAAMRTRAPKTVQDQRLIEGVASSLPIFWGLTPNQVAGIGRSCWTLQVRRGELIVQRDGPMPGVFALGYGSVKLSLYGLDGEERVMRLVAPGQAFGEATALLGKPSRYEARALADCKLVVIPAAAILSLIERDPRFARRMVLTLAERALEMLAEVESATLRRGAQRLASYLVSLAEPAGQNGAPNGSCTVRLPATKTVIASRLNMEKATLSRLLRSLSEQGLIGVAQRDITILDRERLLGLI